MVDGDELRQKGYRWAQLGGNEEGKKWEGGGRVGRDSGRRTPAEGPAWGEDVVSGRGLIIQADLR